MFTGFEILFLAFSGASAAGIASTRKVTRGAFAPTQYREYEEEPQVQRAHRQPSPAQQYHGGGEVHVRRIGSSFYVQSMIAGVGFVAVIDTGASDCVIPHKVMREIGVDLRGIRPEKWNASYTTADGRSVRAITAPLDLTVMGIERSGVACAIMERDGRTTGLIGMSFLSTLSSCEQRGNLLILRP